MWVTRVTNEFFDAYDSRRHGHCRLRTDKGLVGPLTLVPTTLRNIGPTGSHPHLLSSPQAQSPKPSPCNLNPQPQTMIKSHLDLLPSIDSCHDGIGTDTPAYHRELCCVNLVLVRRLESVITNLDTDNGSRLRVQGSELRFEGSEFRIRMGSGSGAPHLNLVPQTIGRV
jgi:hypothetical protein